jgi:hypothetical protein
LCAITSPQLSSSFDVNPTHNVGITALCQSYDSNTIYSGDVNGCLCVSEFDNNIFSTGGKQSQKLREGVASFEFVEEVVILKSNLENKRAFINQLTLRVDELTQNNNHQLRLKELEHKDKITEITDNYTTQLSIERARYEELTKEKLVIEKDFTKRVKNLERKQIEELKNMELKYKTKQNSEENRHKLLKEETDSAYRRWNEENQLLVESHQKYLQELTLEYEEKFLAEQIASKELGHMKDQFLVNKYFKFYFAVNASSGALGFL